MPRPDFYRLNPDDPHDAAIIDADWRKLRARSIRRAKVKGWTRVAAVITTYLVLGGLIAAFLYLLVILLLALASTN